MKSYIFAFGAVLCWASLPAATGSSLKSLNPYQLLFISFTAASIFLYIQQIVIEKKLSLYIPDIKSILIGIWGIFLYHFIYYVALSKIPAAEGAILATTWSFWIVVFAAVLKYKRLPIQILLLAAVGMGGAAIVITGGKSASFSFSYLSGYLLALLCGLIWSSFSIALSVKKYEKDPMVTFTIIAAIISSPFYIVKGIAAPIPLEALLSAVYVGVIPLGLSFYLWNKGLRDGDAAKIGFISYLTTPIAVLLVSVLNGKMPIFSVILGMMMILLSAIVGNTMLSRLKA